MDFRPPVTRDYSSATLVDTFRQGSDSSQDRTAVNTQVEPEQQPKDEDGSPEKAQKTASEGKQQQKEETSPQDQPYKLIHFEANDPENPLNWSKWRKWRALLGSFTFTFAITSGITAYNKGIPSMSEIGATETTGLLGSTSLLVAVGFGPLFLAPMSERWGRKWTIIGSFFIFALLWIPEALAKDMASVIVIRGFQGVVGSVGNTVVGGVVADCFLGKKRSFPMTCFCTVIIFNQALSAVWAGYVELYLDWRWIGWINAIMCISSAIFVFLILEESRADAILSKRAAKLTKETGRPHTTEFDIINSERSMVAALKTSLLRPVIFLLTEPVVICWSLWIGLLWAEVFMLYAGVPTVFAIYDFDVAQTGLVFVSIAIAAFFAFPINWFANWLYTRDQRKSPIGIAPPESRLYLCCIGGVGVPLSLFIFAATARPGVHWFWPCFSLWLFTVFLIPIYVTVNTYLSDSYETYASSALSSAAFLRNILAGILPLFTPVMYRNLGNVAGSCLIGGLASLFIPVPFVLFKYGQQIRKMSKVSKVIAEQQELRALQSQRRLSNQMQPPKKEAV